MAARYLLLLLPALALAKIDIEVSGRFDDEMNVNFSGDDISVISDVERTTFHIGDAELKSAVRAYFGKRPDDAYLHSPTPWGDLYKSYGWREVIRTLAPKTAKIIKLSSEPQIVMQQIFENNSSKPATFNVGISQEVQNTISHSWRKDGALTVTQEINYGFDIANINGGSSTAISSTSSWGESEEAAKSVTIGSTSAVEMVLQPGQSVVSHLEATKAKVQIEVEYEAWISGHVVVNYNTPYKGHHFWKLDVGSVLSAADKSNKVTAKEVIEVGIFMNSKVVVNDHVMGTRLLNKDF